MPSNVRQLLENGTPIYPITERSLVIGLQDAPFEYYVLAWDGASTPVVSKIPAGVVVTYNNTNYTGTLAASATTAPYLYLVASTTQAGEYDRYIVTNNGNNTFSWTPVGSTAPVTPVIVDNLTTNDATKALSAKQGKVLKDELSQFEAEVDELDTQINGGTETITDYTVTINSSGESSGYPDLRDLSGYVDGKTYKITIEANESGDIRINTRDASNQTVQVIASEYQITNGQTYTFYWTKQPTETRLFTTSVYGTTYKCVFTISHNIASQGIIRRIEDIQDDISELSDSLADAKGDITDLDETVNGGTTTHEGYELFTKPSYIRTTGAEVSPALAWRRTDFISISEFYGCKVWLHPSVASVAFYSSQDLSSFLGYAGSGTYGQEGTFLKENLTIPTGTQFVIISTENNPGNDRPYTASSVTTVIPFDGLVQRVENLEQSAVVKSSKGFAHISFDDVVFCLNDITVNANVYDSIFENDFFAVLKDLHDTYGAVFSLFVFLTDATTGEHATGWTLAGTTTKFASEFQANSSWLKFGLHAPNKNTNYSNRLQENTIADYQSFVSSIMAITGTVDCIDRLPRLGNFAGSEANMLALRDCDAGIIGALSAYDTRDSYYLTSAESGLAFKNGVLVDSSKHLAYYTSLKAIEATNPESTWATRLVPATMGRFFNLEWMMHEYALGGQSFGYSNYEWDTMVQRLEYVCSLSKTNGYEWGYPQDSALRTGM